MESWIGQAVCIDYERILMFGEITHRTVYDGAMKREWDLTTYTGRIEWLLFSRRLRQADITRMMGKSSGNMSDVVNGKREFNWADTALLIRCLETNGDFFHGLDIEMGRDLPLAELAPKSKAPPKPEHMHPESDELGELCDQQPEWLRRQMLAAARALVSTVRDTGAEGWDRRLRDAIRMAELTLGPDDADRLLSILQDFIGSVRYKSSPVGELARRS